MGKRKSRTKPPLMKKLPKLDTTFCYPFCNHHDNVGCIMYRKQKIGEAISRICEVAFVTMIHGICNHDSWHL
ncbi:hypothetical protein AMTRI_Chr04g244460 [Amborella trichopoda]